MARHTFQSLAHSDTAYTVHDYHMALWDEWYRTSGALCPWAGSFSTHGDGLTQHGPEIVVTTSRMADYLRSISAAALDRPEIGAALLSVWPATVSRSTIDFLLGVRTSKDDRTRWVSILRGKTTTKDMRHDRRWVELPQREFNGSMYGAWAILSLDDHFVSRDILSRILAYNAIREEVMRRGGACGKLWWDEFGFASEYNQGGREYDRALELATSVIGMVSHRRKLEHEFRPMPARSFLIGATPSAA